jgi:hypothetical protein
MVVLWMVIGMVLAASSAEAQDGQRLSRDQQLKFSAIAVAAGSCYVAAELSQGCLGDNSTAMEGARLEAAHMRRLAIDAGKVIGRQPATSELALNSALQDMKSRYGGNCERIAREAVGALGDRCDLLRSDLDAFLARYTPDAVR